MRIRTGRKVKRTLYVQLGAGPTDSDRLIGVLDEPWAGRLEHAYNAWLEAAQHDTHPHYWEYESHFGQDTRSCACGVVQDVDP